MIILCKIQSLSQSLTQRWNWKPELQPKYTAIETCSRSVCERTSSPLFEQNFHFMFCSIKYSTLFVLDNSSNNGFYFLCERSSFISEYQNAGWPLFWFVLISGLEGKSHRSGENWWCCWDKKSQWHASSLWFSAARTQVYFEFFLWICHAERVIMKSYTTVIFRNSMLWSVIVTSPPGINNWVMVSFRARCWCPLPDRVLLPWR